LLRRLIGFNKALERARGVFGPVVLAAAGPRSIEE
jgi:hypothetical protein